MEPSSEIPQLALLGCGIFARDAYLPILKDLRTHLSLRVIWSRSEVSAKRLLARVHEFSPEAEAEWGEDGMQRILSSPEVHCCAVVLPILSQPKIVMKALQAGKHVLQAVAEGIESLRMFATKLSVQKSPAPIWAVAENFRFEPAFVEAQGMIKELGTMVFVQVNIEVPMNSASKYFNSEWRRDPTLKGAFITDCGVHYVAALRTMLGGCNIVSISAIATHRDQTVPPPDTLTSVFTLENGCSGTMMISFSSPNNKSSWRVVCSKGTVEVERGFHDGKLGYTNSQHTVTYLERSTELVECSESREMIKGILSTYVTSGNMSKPCSKFIPVQGLQEEFKAFANDILKTYTQGAVPDSRSSPSEALQDLAIIETALSSGERKEAPVALRAPIINESLWIS